MIKPYLRDMIINNHKTQGECKVHSGNDLIDYKTQAEWKVLLIMIINFISSKDSDKIRTMRTKSNNKEIMMGNETDEIIEDFLKSLFQKYQEGLEENIKTSKFIFDNIDHGLLLNTVQYVALRGLYSFHAILISWGKRKVLFISLLFLCVIYWFSKYASLCNLIKLVNIIRKYAASKQKRF